MGLIAPARAGVPQKTRTSADSFAGSSLRQSWLTSASDATVDIAHNSSLQYKGKAVDVRQVGRELGVHYVLQGSIRRGGDRVRISVQLIDAVTGIHRWAERYDRQIEDVFAVQDEVARTIVAILAAHVNKAEIERM